MVFIFGGRVVMVRKGKKIGIDRTRVRGYTPVLRDSLARIMETTRYYNNQKTFGEIETSRRQKRTAELQ